MIFFGEVMWALSTQELPGVIISRRTGRKPSTSSTHAWSSLLIWGRSTTKSPALSPAQHSPSHTQVHRQLCFGRCNYLFKASSHVDILMLRFFSTLDIKVPGILLTRSTQFSASYAHVLSCLLSASLQSHCIPGRDQHGQHVLRGVLMVCLCADEKHHAKKNWISCPMSLHSCLACPLRQWRQRHWPLPSLISE